MTAGKLMAGGLVAVALIAGAALYYLQVYHFYVRLPADGVQVVATGLDGDPRPLPVSNWQGIDADSSPIRYRACFDTSLTLHIARASFEPYPKAAPRVAPGWFDCYDAKALGAQIAAGQAQVFLGTSNLEFGIDRVIALTDDGRGYVWHEVNDCGDKAYDGSPLGDDCPER